MLRRSLCKHLNHRRDYTQRNLAVHAKHSSSDYIADIAASEIGSCNSPSMASIPFSSGIGTLPTRGQTPFRRHPILSDNALQIQHPKAFGANADWKRRLFVVFSSCITPCILCGYAVFGNTSPAGMPTEPRGQLERFHRLAGTRNIARQAVLTARYVCLVSDCRSRHRALISPQLMGIWRSSRQMTK